VSESSQELTLIEQPGPSVQLAPLENPSAFVAGYTAMADSLNEIIRVKKLSVRIGQSDHVKVEGWTLLGSMLGVFPQTVWTRPMLDDDGAKIGWEARVEARTRDGALVGAAEAECLRDERTWKSRDDYALRSMAQTRATSKALRQPLGFVVSLAGFDATPAEEMPPPAEMASEFISEGQRRRLFAIAKGNDVAEPRLRELVEEVTGQTSTGAIPRGEYDRLVELVENEGIPFG
jgi:hypothetical protein